MANQSVPTITRPDHVPAELVREFDIFDIPGSDKDPHLATLAIVNDAPEIFWTPCNGGHWVAGGGEAAEAMILDHERFTSECWYVPKKPAEAMRELPIESDPPRHAEIRRPVTAALLPAAIQDQDAAIRELAISLIEDMIDRGECEFVWEFAQIFPICVFLDVVDLPREDRDILVPLAKKIVGGRNWEIREEGLQELIAYVLPAIRARREKPGDDLISQIVNLVEDGAKLSEEDAVSYVNTVMLAGLDTVASMLSQITRFLALNPQHRRLIIANLDDHEFMRRTEEELLRRHGIIAPGRVVGGDFTYRGVEFRKGDSLIILTAMVGLDEQRNKCPLDVDFDRGSFKNHIAFGNGIHTCPGNILARKELRVFLREWLSRIPEFSIAPGSEPKFTTGYILGLRELKLVWPTEKRDDAELAQSTVAG